MKTIISFFFARNSFGVPMLGKGVGNSSFGIKLFILP